MHFLFTAPRFHTNQRFAVKALLDAGHRVSFLALRRQHSETYDALDPIVLGLRGGRWDLPPLTDFRKRMRSLKPDAVIVRDPTTAYGLLSTVAGKMVGANVIFYNQSPMHRRLSRWKKLANALAVRAASAKWITPVLGSPDLHPPASSALSYVPFVMEPQTSPDQKWWFSDGAVNILAIGKFYPRKNHPMFLRAIANLSKRYPIRATIIGECTNDDNRREFARAEELHASLGLQDIVHIKTNIPYSEVQREYDAHDLFVLPSRDEPAAVSHLEAMAHSLPVICSDSNGTQCYVRQGENGHVFKTDDIDDLIDCIERIISDRSKMADMGARSYDLVVSEHSPARYVETLLAIAERRV